jgi:hypothetical protein
MDNRNTTSTRCPAQHSSTPRKCVSLRFEIDTLRDAVQAGRILTDLARHDAATDANDDRVALDATSAILALIEARMLLVVRVISGDVAPALIVAHHNETWTLPEEVTREDILVPVTESCTGSADSDDREEETDEGA